jgi:hypothetical protein
MARVYIYVVDRDFGFAPNPFHGVCTLATCKPIIRRTAQVGDWIIGMGGTRLNATGRCVFGMQVEECMTFDDYWNDSRYRVKRPVRNGSRKMMVGDNIYHRASTNSPWQQEDSHHSLPSGEPNSHNLIQDTQTNRVLISRKFLYFGNSAPMVPPAILANIGYVNRRNHRVFSTDTATPLIEWLMREYGNQINCLVDDPCHFDASDRRYHIQTNRIM